MSEELLSDDASAWLDAVDKIQRDAAGQSLLKTIMYDDLDGEGEKITLRFWLPQNLNDERKVEEIVRIAEARLGVAPMNVTNSPCFRYYVWEYRFKDTTSAKALPSNLAN